MEKLQKRVLTLVRYALSPEESLPALPDDVPYRQILDCADTQQVIPLLYYGACKTPNFLFCPVFGMFTSRAGAVIAHSTQQLEGFDRLTARFEAEGIDYMPVKGATLKRLYPQPEMRTMGDCDVLIRKQQVHEADRIMRELGYSLQESTNHVREYINKERMVIELHIKLLPDGEIDLEPYYGDGWWTARPVPDHPHRYEMRPEDHYVFLFAHFVKHFRGVGAGIKFVIDFHVFRQAYPDMDMDYIRNELEKLGLDEFYDNICRTVAVWFNDAEPDEKTEYLTNRLFNNAVFGSRDRALVSEAYRRTKAEEARGERASDTTRRRRKWFELFFLPYSAMKEKYPVLEHWAILLPLFWIVRGFDILFFHRQKIDTVGDSMENISQESVDAYRAEINYMGLDKQMKPLEPGTHGKGRKKKSSATETK